MSVPPRVPYKALSFLGQTGKAVAAHGLKNGIAKAASKVSPPLLVLEAAVSVLRAVGSFMDLKAVRKHRDALHQLNPLLEQRLEMGRKFLSEQVSVARQQIEQRERIQAVLADVVRVAHETFQAALEVHGALLAQDLPDLEHIEEVHESVEEAWEQVRRAIEAYQRSGA